MLHDLLDLDLRKFNVRAIPHTAAKAQQLLFSLRGPIAWLHHVLQEGAIGSERWKNADLIVSKDHAYMCYEDFSKRQRDYRPETKHVWSKKLRAVLDPLLSDTRTGAGKERTRSFQFAPLEDCRGQFATQVGAPNIEWEPDIGREYSAPPMQPAGDAGLPIQVDGMLDAANPNHERTGEDVARQPADKSPTMPEAFRAAVDQATRDMVLVRQKK